MRSKVTENVRHCQTGVKHLANPEPAFLDCARAAIGNARGVLSCTSSMKRYREAVAYDVQQSVARFEPYTFIASPSRVESLFTQITTAAESLVRPLFEKPKWTLTAFRHEMANATAGAGGRLFLSEGLWTGANAFSDGELAAVLAHEAGHVVLEHSLKHGYLALEWDDATKSIKDATEVFREDLLNGGSRKDAWARMSQADEYAADEIGTQILKAAAFAPEEMINMLTRILPKDGGGFSSGTHPEVHERIERVRGLLKH